MVGLELQKQYPGLKSRSYSSPVFDLLSTPDPHIERYRNAGDIISAFDKGATTTYYWNFFDRPGTLTHQYENIAKNFKPD
jgi:hypothetical protein